MPRRENRSMPRVESGLLYTEDQSVRLDTAEWWAWLSSYRAFYFTSPKGTFTARRELRSGSWYWYAYRKHASKLFKIYLGRSSELSFMRLGEVAELLDRRIAEINS